MIVHDLADWPLALTLARGPLTLAEHSACLAEWTRWLDRQERFAILGVFADEAALVHPDGAAQAARSWLRAHVARIRTQVIAMATVVPAGHLGRMDAERLFGVPAEAFCDLASALRFLGWLVAPPDGLIWDCAALEARLQKCLHEDRPESRVGESKPAGCQVHDEHRHRSQASPHQARRDPP